MLQRILGDFLMIIIIHFYNNDNINNNNGNFICVFECTIVNLATYRQFTNAAWDWIIKNKKKKNKKQNKNKNKTKKSQSILSLGYPSSYFYNKRCNILL